MDYIVIGITTAAAGVLLGYLIGHNTRPDYVAEVEQAWDDGFYIGSSDDLNVGKSEFDLLIDDLNPVRKNRNHFKNRIGF